MMAGEIGFSVNLKLRAMKAQNSIVSFGIYILYNLHCVYPVIPF